ncbi:hypothetical protein TH53_14640 [Pedobacter lusitanus]|uniref:Tail specific protease domain-containing protein n=1 Tax=Pedobacter lusitanus TaxID=1503925 RepID=A0A0D0F4E4_9SPHI|nr:S41 family peptidase [Pedobacter lusitanus]KIO76473.1 hypothetical protein TH53_14640 [Pedobacter lusitanus]
MKKAFISLIILFLIHLNTYAQECNCAEEFQYIKGKIEKNYSGFRDKVNPATKIAYQKYSGQILERSKKINSAPYCINLINEWIGFFKDGHIEVGRNRLSPEKHAADQKRLVQQIEKVVISDADLSRLKNSKSIEGIYWDKDSIYKVAVINNRNNERDYAGVILKSANKTWQPGAVILELKTRKDGLAGIAYDKYYTPESVSLKIGENALGEWQREGATQMKREKILNDDVSCKVLSPQTFYIQIGTFNQRNAKSIDSLLQANSVLLKKTPNLILDLRNNGGGADFSYRGLIPYFYTNPIKTVGPDILSSDDNIAGWAGLLKMNNIPEDQKVFIREKIAAMEQHKNEFIDLGEDKDLVLDSVSVFPKKIVVLINKGCGSTTEQFLLAAKQSKKVTIMGQNSAGVLDYANVRDIPFSCMPYALHYATSRSRRVEMGQGIDNIGITPDRVLTAVQNWVIAAQRFLEQK